MSNKSDFQLHQELVILSNRKSTCRGQFCLAFREKSDSFYSKYYKISIIHLKSRFM